MSSHLPVVENQHFIPQVFPGGNFDQAQDTSLAITAIRETFEESGLLLASPVDSGSAVLSENDLDEARFDVQQQKRSFKNFLLENQLEANTEALLPFTEWVTPVGPPKWVHEKC
jgi:8-oxo-dGTP pyrophosphatase MutT (NUDIX family)